MTVSSDFSTCVFGLPELEMAESVSQAQRQQPPLDQYFTAGKILQEKHNANRPESSTSDVRRIVKSTRNRASKPKSQTQSIEVKQDTFVCSTCNAEYASRYGLKRHEEAKHVGVKYRCSLCTSIFTRHDYAKTHLAKEHQITEKSHNYIISSTTQPRSATRDENKVTTLEDREMEVRHREEIVRRKERRLKENNETLRVERNAVELEWQKIEAAKERQAKARSWSTNTDSLQRQLYCYNSREDAQVAAGVIGKKNCHATTQTSPTRESTPMDTISTGVQTLMNTTSTSAQTEKSTVDSETQTEIVSFHMAVGETQTSPEEPSLSVARTLAQDLELSDSEDDLKDDSKDDSEEDSEDVPLDTAARNRYIKRQKTALQELEAIDEPTILDLLDYDEDGIDDDIM